MTTVLGSIGINPLTIRGIEQSNQNSQDLAGLVFRTLGRLVGGNKRYQTVTDLLNAREITIPEICENIKNYGHGPEDIPSIIKLTLAHAPEKLAGSNVSFEKLLQLQKRHPQVGLAVLLARLGVTSKPEEKYNNFIQRLVEQTNQQYGLQLSVSEVNQRIESRPGQEIADVLSELVVEKKSAGLAQKSRVVSGQGLQILDYQVVDQNSARTVLTSAGGYIQIEIPAGDELATQIYQTTNAQDREFMTAREKQLVMNRDQERKEKYQRLANLELEAPAIKETQDGQQALKRAVLVKALSS